MRWSVHVVDVASGEVLASRTPTRVLPTASVAKVLVLTELAARLEAGEIDPAEPMDRRTVAPVADSGLWQRLAVDVLPVVDAAALVGAVSDNWATNALVARLGLEAVQARGRALGLAGSTLLDLVRDLRRPEDPPTLSVGSAAEWVGAFVRLAGGSWVSPGVSRRVLGWLDAGVDHSMVLSAFGADPLVPGGGLVNKTGTSSGVRADVGLVRRGDRAAAYACLAAWDEGDDGPVDVVLDEMRRTGLLLRAHLEGQAPSGSSGSGRRDCS